MGDVGAFVTLLCNILQAVVSPLCAFAPFYDLLAINRVLPTVPKICLSCILCTWFPLRRAKDSVMGDVVTF